MKPVLYLAALFFAMLASPLLVCMTDAAEDEMSLRGNLIKARPGDYIVTSQSKNFTILLIRDKDEQNITIDEITLPSARKPNEKQFSWKTWVEGGAPGSSCWLMYRISLSTGSVHSVFSFTKNEWVSIPEAQNFLSTLLTLKLKLIPDAERKKVGPPPSSDSLDRRSIWQPPMIIEGTTIKGVLFDAWRTRWPNDSSELAGKIIEVYVPKENDKYPSYFPFWLQINGIVGKAKVRIIDSGSGMYLPNNGRSGREYSYRQF